MLSEQDLACLSHQNKQFYLNNGSKQNQPRPKTLQKYDKQHFARTISYWGEDARINHHEYRQSSKRKRIPIFNGYKKTQKNININIGDLSDISPPFLHKQVSQQNIMKSEQNSSFHSNFNKVRDTAKPLRQRTYQRNSHGLLKPEDLVLMVNQVRYSQHTAYSSMRNQ